MSKKELHNYPFSILIIDVTDIFFIKYLKNVIYNIFTANMFLYESPVSVQFTTYSAFWAAKATRSLSRNLSQSKSLLHQPS